MYNGVIQFQLQDFVNLLTHYTDGEIPRGLEVVNFGPSQFLSGWYGILVKFDKPWPGAKEIQPGIYEPFQFRFEGNKILVMNRKDDPQQISDFDPAANLRRQ